LMNLFLYHCYNESRTQYDDNSIRITQGIDNTSIFDFDLNNETKMNMYRIGKKAAINFIQRDMSCERINK